MTDHRGTDWRLTALDDLLAIDRFRKRQRLPAIRGALFRVVEGYFSMYSSVGAPLPGKPVSDPELPYANLRKTRVYVGRTGGPYRIIFRYDEREQLFEILRIAHPRENKRR